MSTGPYQETSLIVFAKHWTPGEAKTRLIPGWGATRAAEMQRRFLAATLARVGGHFDRQILAITPSEKRSEFADLAGPAWDIIEQGAGHLGMRLERVIRAVQQKGKGQVLVIGSDSPDLPVVQILEGAATLQTHDAVLGPATDGGYYLIGFSKEPCSLKDIDWGSDQVRRQTEERIVATGMSLATLPLWADVDLPEDVDALLRRVKKRGGHDPHLVELRDWLKAQRPR